MAGNVVSNVKKYYGGQVPVPGQGDSDGKVKVLVKKAATMEIGGVQTEVELLFDSDDLTTPVTPQQLGQWTDENYLIAFKYRNDEGVVRGFILYALETDSTSTDTLVNRAMFVNFKEDMTGDPGASAYEFTMVEDSSTLARYLRDENGELIVKFNQASVEAGAQSGTLDNLIASDSDYVRFEVVHEGDNAYLNLNTESLDEEIDAIWEDVNYIIVALDELPSDEHGYFNSSLIQTPGDGTTENIVIDDFRISQGRDVHGENIEFVPTRQEGGVDFGEVYLNPGTYIFTVHYTLQWVGNPRGTFLPLVTNVGDRPFDFSYEHEDVVRTTRIVTRTTRGKFSLGFPIDADTPQMGIWVKNLEIAQIASYNHPAVVHDTTLTGKGQLGDPLGVTPAAFGKIKDIPTSISQFRTGDVIPVDGPNGPAKIDKDNLFIDTLAIYAAHEHSGYLKGYNSFENDPVYHCLYTDPINASAGDTFYYVGRGNAGAKSVIFFDSSKAIISSATYISLETFREITCPADTAYVQFSSYDIATNDLLLCVIKKDGVLASLIVPLAYKKSINDLSIINNIERNAGFLLTNGSWSVDVNYHSLYTDKISAASGDKFLYCGHAESLAASAVFYNYNGTCIGGVQVNSTGSYSEITCPENTAFVQFCSYEPVAKTPKLSVVKVNSQIYGVLNHLPDYLIDSVVYSFTEQDGYLISNGTYEGTSSYHSLTTDKIPASEGDVFLYKGNARGSAKSVLFFNSSNNVISSVSYEALAVAQRIVCPQNTAYAQFSSFDYKTNDVYMSVFKADSQFGAMLTNQTCDILTKSVWIACGDSFTAGDFSGVDQPNLPDGKYAGKKPVYPYYIGNRTLMDVRNIAVGGMTIAQPSDTSFTNVFTKAGGLLYTTNFGAADYITLYFGINDCNKSIPIGTIDDEVNTTFYGAWNIVLNYLRINYPFKHIGIIVTNGCVGHPEYPAAVETIAKKWGVNYLDLDGGVHCQTMVRCSSRNHASDNVKDMINNQQYVSNNNHHPNANAHLFESYFIESWLRTL